MNAPLSIETANKIVLQCARDRVKLLKAYANIKNFTGKVEHLVELSALQAALATLEGTE